MPPGRRRLRKLGQCECQTPSARVPEYDAVSERVRSEEVLVAVPRHGPDAAVVVRRRQRYIGSMTVAPGRGGRVIDGSWCAGTHNPDRTRPL